MKTKSATPVLTPINTPPLPQIDPNKRYSTCMMCFRLEIERTIEQNDGFARLSIEEQLVAFSSMRLKLLPVW